MKTYQKIIIVLIFAASFAAIAITAATERIEKPRSQFQLNPSLIENGTIKGAPLIMQSNQKVCPGMVEQPSVDLSGDGVIYVHCDRCQTGVYLDHENGTKSCSYCSHEQPVLSSR
jgi:hypothetical protein